MNFPKTNFAVKDPYTYLEGLGNYLSSEAIPGANPAVINSPQRPPFNLRTERISSTSFTAPRHENRQTWLYRTRSSLDHSTFKPFVPPPTVQGAATNADPPPPNHLSPNSYMWLTFPVPDTADWSAGQRLLARNGDPQQKSGVAIWLFSITRDMPTQTAFSSLDGETLIVPQAGALDVQTEMGRMVVRQNEIAVVPRGVRYRVTLPAGKPCRGYICELFEGHYGLPDLGAIGSTGLANVRDFQIPVAHFEGSLVDSVAVAYSSEWKIISRLGGKLWTCSQPGTPFDVASWHGTSYPFKYDLARYCVLGNVLFDEHDPSLYVVLTARAHGKPPGTAVVDFAMIPPRWSVARDTYWLPYFHRNTMQEFYGPIVNNQDPECPFNGGHEFAPFGAGLNGSMTTHGASEREYAEAMAIDTTKPAMVQDEGITLFLIETECPLYVSEWAAKGAWQNFRTKPKGAEKL